MKTVYIERTDSLIGMVNGDCLDHIESQQVVEYVIQVK